MIIALINDPNVESLYSFSKLPSNEYYTKDIIENYLIKILNKIGYEVKFFYVNFNNYKQILSTLKKDDIVLNLCDGTEENNDIGISLIREMERLNIKFTGAKEKFYDISTSKTVMKKYFIENNVKTAKYWHLKLKEKINFQEITNYPLFVKPNNFYNSLGINEHAIVHNEEELKTQLKYIESLDIYDVIVEEYLDGAEYTVLITDKKIYPACERMFNNCNFRINDYYDTHLLDENEPLSKQLCELALQAHKAVFGNSYSRVDIRMKNNIPYVLEVNANPGIGPDLSGTNTSIMKILHGYAKQKKVSDIEKQRCCFPSARDARHEPDISTHYRSFQCPETEVESEFYKNLLC